MRALRFSETAERDYEQIWRYTVSEWGYEQASAYSLRIEKALQLLLEQPFAGVARPDIRRDCRVFPVSKHLIFYRVGADVIDILGIPHAHRDIRRHFQK